MKGFEGRAAGYVDRVEHALDARLPAADTKPASLHRAMRYAALGGGKRIRPLLCYAAGEALAIAPEVLDDAACAVEFIHAFSLIHDDLPAMDDDALRRGRPTTHKAFGVATAILAGDALQTLAFGALARPRQCSQSSRLHMLQILTEATGSLGMTGGQALDLEAEHRQLDLAELQEVHRRKTGCLIRASVLMASYAGDDVDDATRARLESYALGVGLAFQIRDDLLDVNGETEKTGKSHGADAAHGKSTYPGLLGVSQAEQRAEAAYAKALAALEPFGDAADPLRWMAAAIVHRDH